MSNNKEVADEIAQKIMEHVWKHCQEIFNEAYKDNLIYGTPFDSDEIARKCLAVLGEEE